MEMQPMHVEADHTGRTNRFSREARALDENVSSTSSRSSSFSSLLPTSQLDTRHSEVRSVTGDRDDIPRWLQSYAGKSRRQSISESSYTSRISSWLKGPSPPRTYTIDPVVPQFQAWPQTKLSKCLVGVSINIISATLFVLWLIVLSVLITTTNSQNGLSADGNSVKLACDTRLWPNTTFCGLDGHNCLPFDRTSFTFFCPSDCASAQVLEPHTIGNQEINYRTMVIGGPSDVDAGLVVYRGDSFICPAAIHAGVISNADGGCGILTRMGEHRRFIASKHNGIQSIDFPSSFPMSFSISRTTTKCYDAQWTLFTISVIATMSLWILTPSPSLLFSLTFIIVFFQVALASDSPYFQDHASIVSMAFERFLPSVFVGLALYQYCVRRVLSGLNAHYEKTVLWLGGCWVGALNHYTFDRIPISRLSPHDLEQQPGAVTALIVILLVIFAAAIGQIWAFRIEGRLLRYLGFYALIGILMACLVALPGLEFRLHHYIIALLLLPGTSIQTRPSLLYQGILLGLFINGVARWGYASILQTPEALREEGQLGSALPQISRPTFQSTNITFTIPELAEDFDGLSMLVNDVERYHKVNLSTPATFEWTRTNVDDPLFFRFGFTGAKPLGGRWYGDYTKPGTWHANGTWEDIQPGPSR